MKKTFSSLLNGADEKDLEGFFDGIEEKAPPEEAIGRIEERVVGQSVKKTRRNLIPMIAAAACLLFAASAVFIAAALNRRDPDTRYRENGVVETEIDTPGDVIPEDALKLEAVSDTVDRFDIKEDLGEGTFDQSGDNGMTDRALYSGVGIFESGGTPYLYYLEGKPIFEMTETGLRNTGVIPPETLLLFRSVRGDVAYLGGTFNCVSVEKGLFRADLLTGKVEKIIDSPEIVSSTAVDGDRIWYSTHPSMADFGYSLKCADLSTGEITVLIRDSDDPIGGLRVVGDDLFFTLYNVGVCRVSDGYLYHVADAPDVLTFEVSDEKIYVYETAPADQSETVRVRVFDRGGNVLASKTVVRYSPYSEEGKNNLYFLGATRDFLTVYDGKVVSFDADGVYLEDVENKTSEKIVGLSEVGDKYLAFTFRMFRQGYDMEEWVAGHRESADSTRSQWFRGISKTVFNGKLYVMSGDELIEYDGKEARVIPFDTAS